MAVVLDCLLLPLVLFYSICIVLPKSAYLRLTPDGFEKCGLVRRDRYKWSDVSNFRVIEQKANLLTSVTAVGSPKGPFSWLVSKLFPYTRQEMVAFDYRGASLRTGKLHPGTVELTNAREFEGNSDLLYLLEGYELKPVQLVNVMTEWKLKSRDELLP